ncbi:dNA primase [Clostridium sp. CAG:452]|jgi:DNA primase|nr:dNA primase [Clostridium sp. CAG:452]
MVRYSEELIDEIRNSNDIVDIISQYVILKRSGRNFFGLCPFHKEKTPSFSVSPDKQIFHCFGCGAGGNVIHFISKIENVDFKESLEILADRAGIKLPTLENNVDSKRLELKEKVYEINKLVAMYYHETLYKPQAKPAQEYVKKRKLDNKALKEFCIGYAENANVLYKLLKEKGFTEEEILASDLVIKKGNNYVDRFKNRLIFPIQDIRNRFIAFGGRVLDNSLPKYINSPENIVYSKARNLYGLNVAKNTKTRKLIIVEGYMDTVSLHQRGIDNVVASCGTALTEAQGRLLRKYAEKVIISYDSDSAGQAATLRGLEILNNLGCDIRILQMEGAKDPDEYVIKYGNGRFNDLVENAISLVEFKIKVLKKGLNIENTNDKIKFMNEIAKILGGVDNKIEQEIYIDKISSDYNISKEAIYAQINKNEYSNNKGAKILESSSIRKPTIKRQEKEINPELEKRENIIISLLIDGGEEVYNKIKDIINPNDFKSEANQKIMRRLYEEFEKGNSNINSLVDMFADDEQVVNALTGIMADDYEIEDNKKALDDVINNYQKEKLMARRNEIIQSLNNANLDKEKASELEKELHTLIIKLAQIK